MKSHGAPEIAASISRRTAIGFGVASGLALASFPAEDLLAKTPPGLQERDMSPELKAAYTFAIKKDVRCGPGYFAVLYPDDNFAGDPVLIGKPPLLSFPKLQAGTMPFGWGAKSGSIVVGPSAVLRLIHKVNDQDVHVTLLPCESMAAMRTVGINDGVSSWKLYPAGDLRPPY
jgi:hypothetical protein